MIHHLRDTQFQMINMFEALDTFFKLADIKSEIDRSENIPVLEDQLKYNFLLKNYLKREPINYL